MLGTHFGEELGVLWATRLVAHAGQADTQFFGQAIVRPAVMVDVRLGSMTMGSTSSRAKVPPHRIARLRSRDVGRCAMGRWIR